MLLFHAPILAMLVGMVASFLIIVVPNQRVIKVFVVSSALAIVVLALLAFVRVFVGGSYVYYMGGWPPPIGIPYVIDCFSAPLAVVIAIVVFSTMLYSIKDTEKTREAKWCYSLRFLMEAGMLGLIFTGDVFHIFVMLEVVGLSAIILVAFRKDVKQAVEAAIKYGIYDVLAISIFYLSTAMIYGMFGSMAMAEISAKLGGYISPISGGIFASPTQALPVIATLIVWSFAIGSALFPLHFWLPDAHSMAPSALSAILSGLIVQINLAVLARILFDGLRASALPTTAIGLYVLLVLGVLSSVVGSALMLVQTDIKRLIAYSTISNIGLIAIGFGVATVTSVSAAYLHIINHAFVKAALFMTAGVFMHATGSREIRSYRGISRSMPYATLLFLVGALASIGFPPLSIFWSKLLLLYSVVQNGGIYSYLVVPILVTVVFEAVAQIRVLAVMYSRGGSPVRDRPSKAIYISIGLPIAITVLIGIMPSFAFEYAGLAASELLDFEKYIKVVLGFLPG